MAGFFVGGIAVAAAMMAGGIFSAKRFVFDRMAELEERVFLAEVRSESFEKQLPQASRFVAIVQHLTTKMENRATAAEIVEISRTILQHCIANESIGLNESLVFALIERESGFNPSAVSWAKAYGLTQVLLPTAEPHLKEMGFARATPELLLNPVVNVEVGIRELLRLKKYWMEEGIDSWKIALTSYFWGPRWTWALVKEKGRGDLPSLEYGVGVLRLATSWKEKGLV
jgi:soluble lytic murein transglycosylase-like protein